MWAVGIGVGAYYAGPAVLDVIADVGSSPGSVWRAGAGGVGFEVTRRRRAQAYRFVPAKEMILGETVGEPTSSWIDAWGTSGIARGSFFQGLPLTNAVTLPLSPATCVRLSGCRHSSKKLPSV